MKKLIGLSLIILTVASGCKNNGAILPSGIYKGIMVSHVCSTAEIETIGSAYLGQETWSTGAPGAPVYHHVIGVQNYCQFDGELGAGQYVIGDTIRFKVIAAQVNDCATCMELGPPSPNIVYAIQIVQ